MKKYVLVISAIFLLGIIIIVTLILWPKKVRLPDNSSLVQNEDFYIKHRNDTIAYLSAVYPTASDKFKSMDALDLAKFYNSLWFYYNCASTFSQNIVQPVNNVQTAVPSCWKELPGCGTNWPKLPYTPQGFIYSFKDWLQSWIPWINSKSDIPISEMSGSFAGQAFSIYTGPAPVWMYQQAIFRMLYNTVLPTFVDGSRIPSLLPGQIGDWKSYWNYPTDWWTGISNNGYIEVTAASEPGLSNSPPLCWVDGWPGSGLFINVGKTFVARNKCDAAFGLAQQMSQTTAGQNMLSQWWNSTDPYEVIKNFIYYQSDNFSKIQGPVLWDPVNKVKIQNCNMLYNNQSEFQSLPYLPMNQIVGEQSSTADYGFWGQPSMTTDGFYDWCPIAKDQKLSIIPNSCIDDIRFGKTYKPDRLNNTTLFDEAIFSMGLWLGYDTIQCTQSANGNNFWQYEILVLYDYPPEAKLRDYSAFIEIDISQTGGSTSCPVYNHTQPPGNSQYGGTKYRDEFAIPYMNNTYKYFSLRDPFDVKNNSRAKPIQLGAVYPTNQDYNITAKGHISDMFTNFSIVGQPSNQCA